MKELEGFYGIPELELTNEEKQIIVTHERIKEYELTIGESFFDQHSPIALAPLCGFLMCKKPEHASVIIGILNDKYGEVQSLEEIYENWDDPLENADDVREHFFNDVCEFVNLAPNTRSRMNTILISIERFYK